jgi:hypothetical protein
MPAKPQSSQLASGVSVPMAFGHGLAELIGRVGARAVVNKVLPPVPAKPTLEALQQALQLTRPNTTIPK